MPDNFVIVTGVPGTGKTAILSGLNNEIQTFAEPARVVLAEEGAAGGDGTPEQNAAQFTELLLQRSIDNYENARQSGGGPVLFDRGIPDCIAYAELLGADPTPSIEAAARYRYNSEVLMARPWEEIYSTDDERKMTFGMTLDFQRVLEIAYERAGYSLVEIPQDSIELRAAFVQDFVAGD